MLGKSSLSAKVAALGIIGLTSGKAFAVFDVQLLGGQRTGVAEYEAGGEDKKKSVTSTEIGFAAHVNPIPKVPLSFGLFAAMNDFDQKAVVQDQMDSAEQDPDEPVTYDLHSSSLKGMTYGPELMVWVPLPFVKPFLRVGYVMGTYTSTTKYDLEFEDDGTIMSTEFEVEYKTAGTQFGIGALWSPVPLVGVFAEYNISNETLTADKAKAKYSATILGQDLSEEEEIDVDDLGDDMKKQTFGSGAIRLGIQVGI